MVSEVGDAILSHISWQQNCSLVTTSTKSIFLNFLPHMPLSASSQSELQVSHLPHWPHHLGLFCKGHSARLWLFRHVLGARWASRWLIGTTGHLQLDAFPAAVLIHSNPALQDQVTSRPLKCQDQLYNVLSNSSRECANLLRVIYLQSLL